MMKEFALYELVERLAGRMVMEQRRLFKNVCANVDFYSGFVYTMLGIPKELFTPIFAIARIPGWSAHRLEEILNASKIIRPAYKYVGHHANFVPFEEREPEEGCEEVLRDLEKESPEQPEEQAETIEKEAPQDSTECPEEKLSLIHICKSTFGRRVYAIGTNRLTAYYSGVHVQKIRFIIYTIMGTVSGLCALFLVSSSYGANTTTGNGFEMDAIAMAVFGGISSTGGKGNIAGGVISA